MKSEWDIESAIATYNVEGWGEGYFTVNSSGNVEAQPLKNDGGSIDLLEVVNEARARNLSFPLLIRFQDLLRHRVESINRAFQNHYRGVFPIKVNQLREVVEEIVDAGEQFHFGLEAGSKPELVAALAMQKGPKTLIICNGYKDPGFIRIALLGRKLGKPVVIVAEKLEEVEQIIRASKEVGVEPWIGIRARLHSKGSGKWSPSGGENAKFGLDTTNLVAASQMLKDAGLAHCLKLVHFHVGSQVPDISTIKRAVREGAPREEALALMHKNRLERVLVINDNFELRGLITVKDVLKSSEHPLATKDELGRLRCAAAIGGVPGQRFSG